ncbi:transcriptional regulator ATRX homolog isoform X1 [Bicyclus anynana]|uniref:Transcriptional regulator ATRX homolog isoform X1 n=1 Tax=Bicyclus anynana TaxID=110368 RepID=A0ABM3LSC1_BICAN|nr:transcriptional regulator ATRX homolog isoform X1 [Bicyclus anynana]
MADSVPVSDVLCEAIEYLSKFGSNLRVRSDNLKEKRIRKEKLRNTHAVQKAASKLLLICELSKKSIENVETGIKKVLRQIDFNNEPTTSDGGNSSYRSSKSAKNVNYEYIVYNSQRLRIRKKVNMKHFTSVKVFVKALPTSTMDMYRSKKKSVRFKEVDSDEVDNSSSKLTDIVKKGIMKSRKDQEDELSQSQIDLNCLENHTNLNITDRQELMDKQNSRELSEKDGDNEAEKNTNEKAPKDEDLTSGTKPKNDTKCKPSSKSGRYRQIYNSSESDRSQSPKVNTEKCDPGNIDKTDPDKSKDNTNKNSSENSLASENPSERKNSFCDIVELNDSSNDELTNNDSCKKEPVSNESKLEGSHLDKDNVNIPTNNDSETISEKDSQPKPLIRCVSLDKLLKKDVKPPNTNENKDQNSSSKLSQNKTSSKKHDKSSIKSNNKISKYYQGSNSSKKVRKESCKENEEEEYWVQKRKEVKEFRPKNCIIRVKRLPEFSQHYLSVLNLGRITQKGVTICEIPPKVDEASEKHSKIRDSPIDISCAKDALLKDSDSDKSKDLADTPRKVKRALLKESESECDETPSEITPKTNKKAVQKLSVSDNDDDVNHSSPGPVKPTLQKDPRSKNNKNSSSERIAHEHKSGSDNDENLSLLRPEKKESESNNPSPNELQKESGSEKDKNPLSPTPVIEEVHKESRTEKNDENPSSPAPKNDEKQTSNDDQESRNNKTPEPVNPLSEIISDLKSSLLFDSADENNKTPSRKTVQNTPPSKRKTIMESMHAKKMLLTYSSSSDTEDEQLRNVLKEIRGDLLKKHSSDEENKKVKDNNEKRISDSGEEPVKVTKRKKDDKASSSSSESKKNKNRKSASKDDAAKNSSSQDDDNTEKKSNRSLKKKMGPSKMVQSSSHNSDNEDNNDKDIDGLTNLRTLRRKTRRRHSTSSDRTQSTTRSLRSKKSKAPQISEEGFLKAEDSSDEKASLGESDVGEETELPAVSASVLNGDGFGHLAKDDLLGESDSFSSEQNKSSQEVKEEDDSDEEGIKSRRRKGNVISSDSEVGSRKKDATVKFSDFEDSQNDSSEPTKRKRKRIKRNDSDASSGSSAGEGKKKRRRIKNLDNSDGSGSDSENEGKNKHGRKNIRKVKGTDQLEEATKKAARQEKERIARIAERQKLYNNFLFDESGKSDAVVLDKVVLDFDPDTKEPLIEVDKGLVKKLKPHQANGIKFMWDACFESVKRIKKDKGSGCILAHCMGLGKTLQVVSLTHTLLTHSELTRVNRVLVVCPLSTVLNWVNEFNMWIEHAESDYEVEVYEVSKVKPNAERAYQLQLWLKHGGVCVLGYEMFRNLSANNVKKFKKKMLKSFQECLVDPGPDLVVCDEGHLLKNEKTSLSQAMNRVKTLRRIVLTGTPLQNNLKEYYCMVQFVKPNLLGKYNEYLNRFVNPITNGQYTDSTEHDIRIMKRRAHVLHKMLDGSVQRRDYGVLAPFLPPKMEFVFFITLSEIQIQLYQHYLDNYSRRPQQGGKSFLFSDYQSLQRIWTHPLVLKYNSEKYEIMQQKKRDKEEEEASDASLADFIDDNSTPEESSSEESDSSSGSDDSRKKEKNKKKEDSDKKSSRRRGTRLNPVEGYEDPMAVENDAQPKEENPTEWWMSLISEDELDDMRHSHKLMVLFEVLRQCEAIGDKLLVFSQSLYSLDLIEHFLGKVDEATQSERVDEKLNGHAHGHQDWTISDWTVQRLVKTDPFGARVSIVKLIPELDYS